MHGIIKREDFHLGSAREAKRTAGACWLHGLEEESRGSRVEREVRQVKQKNTVTMIRAKKTIGEVDPFPHSFSFS